MAAAGNKYIADSIIYHLSKPNDIDMVIVSWTSLTKIDKLVADSSYFNNYLWKKRVGDYDYVLSGGTVGSWLQNSIARLLFENDYKFSNLEIYGFNNLIEMIKLQSFLESKKIPYYFTSCLNYWGEEPGMKKGTQDFDLGQFESLKPLLNQINFDKFLYIKDNKPYTVYDLATEQNSFESDKFHPGGTAIKDYAEMVNATIQNYFKEQL